MGAMYVIDPKTKKEKLDQKGSQIRVEDRTWKDRPETWKLIWNDGTAEEVTEEDVVEQFDEIYMESVKSRCSGDN